MNALGMGMFAYMKLRFSVTHPVMDMVVIFPLVRELQMKKRKCLVHGTMTRLSKAPVGERLRQSSQKQILQNKKVRWFTDNRNVKKIIEIMTEKYYRTKGEKMLYLMRNISRFKIDEKVERDRFKEG